jgi:hypothetical protein
MYRSVITLAMAISIASIGVPSYAASPGYCQSYANQAVRQFHRYQSIPDCFHGADRRWSANWSRHYSWCIGASVATARAQAGHRGTLLRQCSFLAYGHY